MDGDLGVVTASKVRVAAMDILTGREYSRTELETKLRRKFPGHASIETVLVALAGEQLQCDRRFTEAFVRSRLQRGQGPRRIRAALREKGIDTELFEETIVLMAVDWFSLATQVLQRKQGGRDFANARERAQRMRFLQYRGFTVEQTRFAIESLGDSVEFDV